jgi:hypothetical protein
MDCAATLTSNVLDGAFEVVAVPRDENHARAALRGLSCGDKTDTARSAGNDDHLFAKWQERNLHDCLSGYASIHFERDSTRPVIRSVQPADSDSGAGWRTMCSLP